MACVAHFVLLLLLLFFPLAYYYVYSSQAPSLIRELQQSTSNISSAAEKESCDIFNGNWVPDSEHPQLYTQECKYIQLYQNCLKNGRPDKGYLNWRWKPNQCELPRFEPTIFLQLMTSKKVAFIGDSLARNHMQSLICTLSQTEQPQLLNQNHDTDFTYGFVSYNFTLSLFWSPFLVKNQVDEKDENIFHLYLDVAEDVWKSELSKYDVVVISTGQWYYRSSIYYLNNTAVGCYGTSCINGTQNLTSFPFTFGFRNALENVFKAIANDENGFEGISVLRTVSAEHFEYGKWNTGGTCNRTAPFKRNEVSMDWTLSEMHNIQMEEFRKAVASGTSSNGSKLKVLDITLSSFLRPDGHAGPYRRPYVDHKGKVQSDCLHWCLPGPIDMWNELLLYILQ